jgi:hypothetical protein
MGESAESRLPPVCKASIYVQKEKKSIGKYPQLKNGKGISRISRLPNAERRDRKEGI